MVLRDLTTLWLFTFMISVSVIKGRSPLIIAHRGSSAEYPDLSMPAFRRAVDQKADMLELDLCVTKDGKLVIIHDHGLSLSTDVANRTEFRHRRRNVSVTTTARTSKASSKVVNDWHVTDFTLAEILLLTKRQRYDFRNPNFDGLYYVPSFTDLLLYIRPLHSIGLLIELKTPSYFNGYLKSSGISNSTMEELVLQDLISYGFHQSNSGRPRVVLQTFEEDSVARMLRLTNFPVVLLQHYGYIGEMELKGLASAGLYGIAPWKMIILGVMNAGSFKGYKNNFMIPLRSEVVDQAHALGLKVYVWTFRNEDRYLAWNFGNDPIKELDTFTRLEVDGFITDFPATAIRALRCVGIKSVTPYISLINVLVLLSIFHVTT